MKKNANTKCKLNLNSNILYIIIYNSTYPMKGTFSTNALGIFYTLGWLLYQEIRKMLWYGLMFAISQHAVQSV